MQAEFQIRSPEQKEANAEGTNKVIFPNALLTITNPTAFACLRRLPYTHLL